MCRLFQPSFGSYRFGWIFNKSLVFFFFISFLCTGHVVNSGKYIFFIKSLKGFNNSTADFPTILKNLSRLWHSFQLRNIFFSRCIMSVMRIFVRDFFANILHFASFQRQTERERISMINYLERPPTIWN